MTGTNKVVRLSKAAREFNISLDSIVTFLTDKGYDIDRKPNTKLDPNMYELLTSEFQNEKHVKEVALQKGLEYVGREESASIEKNVPKPEVKPDANIFVEKELIIKNTGVSFDDSVTPKKQIEVEAPISEKIEEIQKPEEPAEVVEVEKPIVVIEDDVNIEKESLKDDGSEILTKKSDKEDVVDAVVADKEPEKVDVIEEKPVAKDVEVVAIETTTDSKPEVAVEKKIEEEVKITPKEVKIETKVVESKPEPKPKSKSESKPKPEPDVIVNQKDEKDKESPAVEVADEQSVKVSEPVIENVEANKKEILADAEPVVEKVHEQAQKTEENTDDTSKGPNILGTIDLDVLNQKTRPTKKSKAEKKKEREQKNAEINKLKTKFTKDRKAKEPQKTQKPKPVADKTDKKPVQKPKQHIVAKDIKESKPKTETVTPTVKKATPPVADNFIKTKVEKLTGPTLTGEKIDLKQFEKKVWTGKPQKAKDKANKKKRKRLPQKAETVKTANKNTGANKTTGANHGGGKKGGGFKKKPFTKGKPRIIKTEPTEEEIQQKIKDTLARLAPSGKSKAAKHRKRKREYASETVQQELQRQEDEKKIIKVTEFVTANEMATMMNVGVTEIITSCMQLGLFVSINQRLDAETIVLVAEEFGYQTSFVSIDDNESLDVVDEEDVAEDLVERAPIVTVMGHVDHGKTKLLDYIRRANVVSGEAGGITQHIGAYEVETDSGRKITFLDTPGHEAFTAMRARGAKVTDVAIIVIAADDSVMPQTKEAINHAQAAGVPIIFAINKIDKEAANPERVKDQLAQMNILVEDWGGKFQSQEISAITGAGIPELLEKVLLESEMLELKANPNRVSKGTVIEATLDKGRGYVTTVLVQNGTLKKGDVLLAGPVFGKVKAMFNERNQVIETAGPSTPAIVLGLIAAPRAGDIFNGIKDEKEAKTLASKRQQLIREQGLRTQKHLTLDEIGRRIAIGEFKELNVIVKGDVDGSIEALTDALLKLSTEEVQVNVIHKAVGAISETDVMLASASDAIIIGFQVRPSVQARRLAEKEEIDIRLYSIIYQATEELETAIKGMLSPKIEEKVTCNIEVRETFRITKVGTIAGCYVLDGKVNRNTKVRIIRDGIVVYTGVLGSLKRFKDDVKEVARGYECGLNIENYNDIKVADIIEGYEMVEVAR